MIEESTDEVMVEKAAAERLRKSEVARAKRKAVKEKKELTRDVFDKSTVFGEQSGAFFIAPLLMAIDFTVDIVRSRYQEFKQEQQDIIDVISGSKK